MDIVQKPSNNDKTCHCFDPCQDYSSQRHTPEDIIFLVKVDENLKSNKPRVVVTPVKVFGTAVQLVSLKKISQN
jgi:hypothetical protein